MIKITVINYGLRRRFGLDNDAYTILDIIYKLSTNPEAPVKGWCSARRLWMVENLMIPRTTLWRKIDHLIESDLLVEHPDTKNLKTTRKWNKAQPNVINADQEEAEASELAAIEAEKAEYENLMVREVEFVRYAITMNKADIYLEMKEAFIAARMAEPNERWLKSTNNLYRRWMKYVNNFKVKGKKSESIDDIDDEKFLQNA